MHRSEIRTRTHGDYARATVEMDSDFKEIASVIDRLMTWLSDRNCQAIDLFAMQMAVMEALANAIRHGIQLNQKLSIHLRCLVGPTQCRIRISDEGQGFDPASIPAPIEPDGLELPTGRGLWLMRHYMDRVRFNVRGNSVTLTRELKKSPVSTEVRQL